MSWQSDIEEWALANDRDPIKVEKICIRKGWNPAKYHPSMKDHLHDWLTQWYTLSVKTLPEPATLRRNPLPPLLTSKVFCQDCMCDVVVVKQMFDGALLGACGDAIFPEKRNPWEGLNKEWGGEGLDEEIRQTERAYLQKPTEVSFTSLNNLRKRVGLKPLTKCGYFLCYRLARPYPFSLCEVCAEPKNWSRTAY